MGGFGDHVAMTGDWLPPPSPSPRAFFSSIIGDDFGARSIIDYGSENKSEPTRNDDEKHQTRASMDCEEAGGSKVMFERNTSSRGGLMERMAARAGFNAPRLNTESIRPADLSKTPEVNSPYLTIPPGLSPTTLLESPVFLSNSLVQPSPTTGKFSFILSGNNQNSAVTSHDTDKGKENTFEDINTSSFAFRPFAESSSFPHFSAVDKVNSAVFAPPSFPGHGVPVTSDTSVPHQSTDLSKVHSQSTNELFQQANFSNSHKEREKGRNVSSGPTYDTVGVPENSPPLDAPNEDDGDQRSGGDPNVGGGPAEDGYNWRKYGQKHVKGSEFPRSYYKCTHPNCPVKKKVERSPEGHITEIIYKGAHNHSKPPLNRRSAIASSNAFGDMQLDSNQLGIGANGDHTWLNMQKGNTVAPDWRQDGVEGTSSAALGQEYGNGGTFHAPNGAQYETLDGGMEGSSTFSNDDEEDRLTHGSVSLGCDGEGDESESKRRRIEAYASEMSGATRALREPRVVVQTTSEVDILDDGYRWRKYGQKVVKGNPNPRSYYKCTSAGCNVRKHVERASHDLKSVITTYEGKHNHDVPAARNSSHMNNNGGSNALSTKQAPANGPESSQNHRFERQPLSSFGLSGRAQYGQVPSFGYGLNQPGLQGLGINGFGSSHGKFPVLPGHPYLGQMTHPMNGMGFMLPKGEPKLEPITDSGLNPPNSSSVYQQFMNRLPLGPQM